MVTDLPFKVQSFSKYYQETTKIWRMNIGIPDDLDKIKNDAYLAIRYLTGMVHERAGASPNFSKYHRLAIKEALQGRNFSGVIIHDENYPDNVCLGEVRRTY